MCCVNGNNTRLLCRIKENNIIKSPAIEMKNDAGKNSVGIESRLQEWNLDDLSIQNKRVNYIRAGISMMLGHI